MNRTCRCFLVFATLVAPMGLSAQEATPATPAPQATGVVQGAIPFSGTEAVSKPEGRRLPPVFAPGKTTSLVPLPTDSSEIKVHLVRDQWVCVSVWFPAGTAWHGSEAKTLYGWVAPASGQPVMWRVAKCS